jgi:hypothetical protein
MVLDKIGRKEQDKNKNFCLSLNYRTLFIHSINYQLLSLYRSPVQFYYVMFNFIMSCTVLFRQIFIILQIKRTVDTQNSCPIWWNLFGIKLSIHLSVNGVNIGQETWSSVNLFHSTRGEDLQVTDSIRSSFRNCTTRHANSCGKFSRLDLSSFLIENFSSLYLSWLNKINFWVQ